MSASRGPRVAEQFQTFRPLVCRHVLLLQKPKTDGSPAVQWVELEARALHRAGPPMLRHLSLEGRASCCVADGSRHREQISSKRYPHSRPSSAQFVSQTSELLAGPVRLRGISLADGELSCGKERQFSTCLLRFSTENL